MLEQIAKKRVVKLITLFYIRGAIFPAPRRPFGSAPHLQGRKRESVSSSRRASQSTHPHLCGYRVYTRTVYFDIITVKNM